MGNDAAEIVRCAREAAIDLLAITDHQSFQWIDSVIDSSKSAGRTLAVLPGIEITANEGCHLLAVFPQTFLGEERTRFLGWLDIPGTGDTRKASKKYCLDILDKVTHLGGVVIMPHPYSAGIGALDSARKMNTKMEWLESGHFRLVQIEEDKITYIERDEEGNFLNRFVLASSPPNIIRNSRYSLAPFNRSDAHKAEQVREGCSWFRMAEPTVEGLKQVGCEPLTRISRTEPAATIHDCILGVQVEGGYCDGQFFKFSDALTCVVGQNHAGKSSVFDFLRYALAHEEQAEKESSQKLLRRLNGILKPGGTIEVYLKRAGCLFAVKRSFNPIIGTGPQAEIECKHDRPLAYRLNEQAGNLDPVQDFTFPIEVYEQGRIGRLRDDISRQLQMLDEFANIGSLVVERSGIVRQLGESANRLKPLYEKRESLRSEVTSLAQLEAELSEKQKFLPDQIEEQRWANSAAIADALDQIVTDLISVSARIPSPQTTLHELSGDLQLLFGQCSPEIDANSTAEAEALRDWRNNVQNALTQIAAAREMILSATNRLASESAQPRTTWNTARLTHDRSVSDHIGRSGYESPRELINRVNQLRKQILSIKNTKQPLLSQTESDISNEEVARDAFLGRLATLNRHIRDKRLEKSRELTEALEGQMKIGLRDLDRTSYQQTLHELCAKIASQRHNIRDREGQLAKVIANLLPLELAKVLRAKGKVVKEDGSEITLEAHCGITLNTQNVLCSIADDVELLNRLQTVIVPDMPEILVKRWREDAYANLNTGLSPGEQSAAILMLALQTRTMPLILDQPEEDLGYNFVVHLVVPKMLKAKFQRQLLVVTLQANIPVLGDADLVLKMENNPAGTSRRCIAAATGCFECPDITRALLELEGGEHAFQFRQNRYRLALPPK